MGQRWDKRGPKASWWAGSALEYLPEGQKWVGGPLGGLEVGYRPFHCA